MSHGRRVKLVDNALSVAQVGSAVDAVRLAGSPGLVEETVPAAVQHGSGASRAEVPMLPAAEAGEPALVRVRRCVRAARDVPAAAGVGRLPPGDAWPTRFRRPLNRLRGDDVTTPFMDAYGPWAVIAGGSDGVGSAFAHKIAARGLDVVLVARRVPVLEASAAEIREKYGVRVRTVALDLSVPDAAADLAKATSDLEIGLFVFNAGSDDAGVPFLHKNVETHASLIRRNCSAVMETAHHFGAPMTARGHGGLILVTSGAAWAGGATLSVYGATKAFDLLLAESLWAEWHEAGVHVLGLVLGRTDTPSLRRTLKGKGEASPGELADPNDVAEAALEHLADGPVWIYGSADPTGASPLGMLSRRDAVLLMSRSWSAKSG
ncbi:SDR family NAD(P)-dependent oxidoreductase [Streptomyces sp. NPDC001833]|uniref:SDR family NAD(P)-dependent oxidoreductase n=1 Tax=Streptomyces sp. NPDC001833 TaxID=3154658 RepID=UPI00331ED59C